MIMFLTFRSDVSGLPLHGFAIGSRGCRVVQHEATEYA